MRYAERQKNSAHAKCAKQAYASHVTPLSKRSALTAMKHGVRFVESIYHHEPATHVANWFVKITELELTSPLYVIIVGRVTYE